MGWAVCGSSPWSPTQEVKNDMKFTDTNVPFQNTEPMSILLESPITRIVHIFNRQCREDDDLIAMTNGFEWGRGRGRWLQRMHMCAPCSAATVTLPTWHLGILAHGAFLATRSVPTTSWPLTLIMTLWVHLSRRGGGGIPVTSSTRYLNIACSRLSPIAHILHTCRAKSMSDIGPALMMLCHKPALK